MKALLRTLAIIATVALLVQTVRHAYLLWVEPRSSVLDKYDRPMKDEIEAATSLDELLKKYVPIRKTVDSLKALPKAEDAKPYFLEEKEPYKSERALSEAIRQWESRSNELRSLRVYTLVGLVFATIGLIGYQKGYRWPGVTLLITGFAEAVYWTSPSFLMSASKEFDRLLVNKLILTVISLIALSIAIRALGIFREEREH